jgi:predicted metal-dependent hydrolase
MAVQSALLFETLEDVYGRVFEQVRPRLNRPQIRVSFRRFTTMTSRIRLVGGVLDVRISDLLEEAPGTLHESLAWILISKLFRENAPSAHVSAYQKYVAQVEVRMRMDATRRQRGSKRLAGEAGQYYDLGALFDQLNAEYFSGALSRPQLGWSLNHSRTILGHYDAAHHAIALSRRLDHATVPDFVVAYVLYHEMLHIKHPVEHHGSNRKIHTRPFQEEEKRFRYYAEAKAFLKTQWR